MSQHQRLSELLELPPEERLVLVEALWDSLLDVPHVVPVPDWHLELIDQRLAADDADKSPGESWDSLRRRIEGKA